MPNFVLDINEKKQDINAQAEMPLLWVLRDKLHLTGTKYGCGLGACGICLVHIDGKAIKACQISIKDCVNKKIYTIEGLNSKWSKLVKEAWAMENVPQCGYCQPGQIMKATALFMENPHPNKAVIDQHMNEVLCRCGTYARIKKAIERVKTSKNEK